MDMHHARWLLASIALFAVLGALIGHDPRLLGPGSPVTHDGPARAFEVRARDCRVTGGSCTAVAAEGASPRPRMTLQLPESPSALTPFAVRVRLPDTPRERIGAVGVRFRMVGMDMGRNRYSLTRSETGAWRTQVTLPICSTGRRDWQAVVEARVAGELWRARFPFVVDSPR